MKRASLYDPNTKRNTGRRTWILLFLMLALILTMTACGGEDDGAEDKSPEQETEAAEETEAEAPKSLTGKVSVVYSKDMAFAAPVVRAMEEKNDNYNAYSKKSESGAVKDLLEGKAQFAILSPTKAAEVYKKDKDIRLVSPVFLGGYRFRGDPDNLYRAYDLAPANGTTGTADDSWKPQNLRSATLNLWGNTEELTLIANAVLTMDGGTVYSVTTQETIEDLAAVLKIYNQFTLVNGCQLKGMDASVGDLSDLVDVDAFWEKKVGQPLPAAVLVVSKDFLTDRKGEIDTVLTDYEAAFGDMEQPYKKGKLVFYGSSDRGATIMKAYYETIYTGENEKRIPKDSFYYDR